MKPGLEVKIGKLRLKNPVMAASGTFGEEYKDLVDINSLGAVVAKTITLKPYSGNPPPRLAETPSGMLNSIGLENKGLDDFLKNKMKFLKTLKIPVIASIAGEDESEFKELAKHLSKVKRVDAIEVNLSCPNIKGRGMIAQDAKATYRVITAVRKATSLTMIAKLSPNVTDINQIAKSAEVAGADAVTLINTILGMAVDIDTKSPVLGNVTGGLSGPAIRPIALRMVWETRNKIKIPIIGAGGIMDYKDAIEFILCGAKAIQVGTANFVNPKATTEIIDGIKRYLVRNKIRDINRLVGTLNATPGVGKVI
ncbi:MAG: dihydroorotate dehydrogenase [Candidatus Omnitrophica bacterium]|nr:dihydroorotate dehydrogenase [Candidatus Omnitrophota bacterium]